MSSDEKLEEVKGTIMILGRAVQADEMGLVRGNQGTVKFGRQEYDFSLSYDNRLTLSYSQVIRRQAANKILRAKNSVLEELTEALSRNRAEYASLVQDDTPDFDTLGSLSVEENSILTKIADIKDCDEVKYTVESRTTSFEVSPGVPFTVPGSPIPMIWCPQVPLQISERKSEAFVKVFLDNSGEKFQFASALTDEDSRRALPADSSFEWQVVHGPALTIIDGGKSVRSESTLHDNMIALAKPPLSPHGASYWSITLNGVASKWAMLGITTSLQHEPRFWSYKGSSGWHNGREIYRNGEIYEDQHPVNAWHRWTDGDTAHFRWDPTIGNLTMYRYKAEDVKDGVFGPDVPHQIFSIEKIKIESGDNVYIFANLCHSLTATFNVHYDWSQNHIFSHSPSLTAQ